MYAPPLVNWDATGRLVYVKHEPIGKQPNVKPANQSSCHTSLWTSVCFGKDSKFFSMSMFKSDWIDGCGRPFDPPLIDCPLSGSQLTDGWKERPRPGR